MGNCCSKDDFDEEKKPLLQNKPTPVNITATTSDQLGTSIFTNLTLLAAPDSPAPVVATSDKTRESKYFFNTQTTLTPSTKAIRIFSKTKTKGIRNESSRRKVAKT